MVISVGGLSSCEQVNFFEPIPLERQHQQKRHFDGNKRGRRHIYINAVESKFGPKWPFFESKLGPRWGQKLVQDFILLVFPNFIVYVGAS